MGLSPSNDRGSKGTGTAAKLARSREFLLDLTLRNRLLNFPQGDPHFKERDARIHRNLPVIAMPDKVWALLVNDGKSSHVFSHPAEDGDDPKPMSLLEEGELYSTADDEHLEKRLQKLFREQQTLESSTGDSAFFLALGFLEWMEAPPKEARPLFAPLLLLHVALMRKTVAEVGRRKFVVEMDADQHSGNPSLFEKLRSEHNIILPSSEEITTPEAYFRKVEAAIQSKPSWCVHRTAALGFFNFARYRLWLDMDERQWPAGSAPAEHPLVRDLVDQKWTSDARELPTEQEIAEHQEERDLPIVLNADSTQYAALLAAGRGQSLVIIGPPGSGKSQTIANLIAISLADGKRVLFVAQKLAALQVVERLLSEIGMNAFCLPLHSQHSKPKEVHQRLHMAGLEHHRPFPTARVNEPNPASLAKSLNDIAGRFAHTPRDEPEAVAVILGRACALRAHVKDVLGGKWDEQLLEIDIPDGPISQSWMDERIRSLREWSRLRGESSTFWEGWKPIKLSALDTSKIDAGLRNLLDAIEQVNARMQSVSSCIQGMSFDQLQNLTNEIQLKRLPEQLVPSLLQFVWLKGDDTQPVHYLERSLKDFHRQRSKALAVLREPMNESSGFAEGILAATGRLLEHLKSHTSVVDAKQILDGMATALDQLHDVIALAATYSEAIQFLSESGGAALTFHHIDLLARVRHRREMDVPPTLHASLAQHLISDPSQLSHIRMLADQLDHARQTTEQVKATVPDLFTLSKEDRAKGSEAIAILLRMRLESLPYRRLGELRDKVVKHVSSTNVVLTLCEAPEEALCRLTPVLTEAACHSLAKRRSVWTREAIEPPEAVHTGTVRALSAAMVTATYVNQSCDMLDSARSALKDVKGVFQRATVGDSASAPSAKLRGIVHSLSREAAETLCVSSVQTASARYRDTAQVLNRSVRFFSQISKALGQSLPTSFGDLERLSALTAILRTMPKLPPDGLLQEVSTATDASMVRQAMTDCLEVVASQCRLEAQVAFPDIPPRQELAQLRRRFRAHSGKIFRWLKRDYRAARALLRGFTKIVVASDKDAIALLDELETLLNKKDSLINEPQWAKILGPAFKGLDTKWNGANEVLDWAAQFYAQLGPRPIPLRHFSAVNQQGSSRLGQADSLLDATRRSLSILHSDPLWAVLSGSSLHKSGNVGNVDKIAEQCLSIASELDAVSCELDALGCEPSTSLRDVEQALGQWDAGRAALEKTQSLGDLVHAEFQSIDTIALRDTARWFEKNVDRGIAPEFNKWLADQGSPAVDSTVTALDACEQWDMSGQSLSELLQIEMGREEYELSDRLSSLNELAGALSNVLEWSKSEPHPGLTIGGLRDLLNRLDKMDEDLASSSRWDEVLQADTSRAHTDQLRDTAAWVSENLSAGAPAPLLKWCLEAETTSRFLWWQRLAEPAAEFREAVDRLLKWGLATNLELQKDRALEGWREQSIACYAGLAESIDILTRSVLSPASSLQDISSAAAAMMHATTLGAALDTWTDQIGVAPTTLQAAQVASHRSWIASLRSFPVELVAWLIEGNPTEKCATIDDADGALRSAATTLEQLLQTMRKFGELKGNGPAQIRETSITIQELEARAQRLLAFMPRLLPWATYLREQVVAERLNLSSLLDVAIRASLSIDDLLLAFRAAVAFQQGKRAWQEDAELMNFRGSEFQEVRSRFAEADQSKLERNRAHVVDQILRRSRDGLLDTDRIATPEMFAVLAHEENKQRKHLPVRRLIERAGPAIQSFCPCWLMTPLAVAQFLPPGKTDFDLIIMDEASQLPPEDAWGAIARGKQLIVVGDPKQMPPSDFFASSALDDESEDEQPELNGATLDSILDTAKNCLRQSDLRWHYRSRHQSLIAAANRFSYNDRLILFPSAFDKHPEMGVRHHYVPNAVATTGRVVNSAEAAAVIERLIKIAMAERRKPRDERFTVGVVAMNQPQMDCIQELLDSRRAANRAIDEALTSLEENTAEPLFIKNLENIQGDQRDIILISYTYAANTAGGTPAQRFGPITFAGGERRFNVLITRAKWRMEIFASIRSDQIQITGKNPGVHHFHHFLKYAEMGKLVDPGIVVGRSTDSPFEDHVIAILREEGYEVEPQVGVAGYFIDIAVRDPEDRDRFFLGIECDGATYHSSKAARDRDRLREEVLKDRGWSLYRIWSTDWFTNHESAKEALIVAVARVYVNRNG